MSNRTLTPRPTFFRPFGRIAGRGLLVWASVALLGLHGPAIAAGPEQPGAAPMHLAALDGRHCWARYSTSGAQPQDGQIEETAFRVPCPEVMTFDFIATLQRALAARGHYDGPITGQADTATRSAVRNFQRAQGFDSPILTLQTAQRLGLVPAEIARN